MAETSELETIEQERKTNLNPSGGGGQHAPIQTIDPETLYRSALNKERKKLARDITAELADYNVKPVLDAKGRVDLKATLAALAKAGQPEAAAVLEQRYSGKIAELSHENEKLKADIQQTRVTAVVREQLSALAPLNLDDAVYLFQRSYNIRLDEEDGSLMVCNQAGEQMHDAGTLLPLTVEMAAKKFALDKPGLFGKQSGNGLQGLGSMKGSPSTSRNEDLQEHYVAALQAGDKEKAARLLTEMQGRVKRQFGREAA